MAKFIQRIGIIGGGQLARMSAQAAQSLGLEVTLLDSDPRGPAAQVTPHVIEGQWSDFDALSRLADAVDIITLENEWVSPEHLSKLEQDGAIVRPGAQTLAWIGDKLGQRERLAAAGLPVPAVRVLENWDDARAAAREWGYPLVLKARHGGYDGYGVRLISSEYHWDNAPESANAGEWYAEQFVSFADEVAVMVARTPGGDTAAYPVVQSVQTPDGHRCDVVTAPAPTLTQATANLAAQMAIQAVEAAGGVGLFGVELFLTEEGSLLVNELAPRPHNSGHYTMDACATSQFEQHIRAVCDWPLGPTHLLAPCAVMVNLLAPANGVFEIGAGLERAFQSTPVAHVHWYGKSQMRTGRKMGHINVLADETSIAIARARAARAAFWGDLA